ncbi:MAG: protein kinase domain-containing protein [Candidatus Omnitrophota bacterium]
MICSNCGTDNVLDARFCKTCGKSVTNDLSAPSQATEVVPRLPADSENTHILGNRFRPIKKLGQGGMGEVLLAEDVKLKRNVAIKSILLKENIADNASKTRFLREAQTASRLDHPNICTIYEICEENERDYIIMQYIDGVTLEKIIETKKLNIDKILDISTQVCSGMMEAHANGIIHRDIKPGNIMVDKKGTVKILDFGLAKFSGPQDATGSDAPPLETTVTQQGFVMGTVAYISPEQARGKILDPRSDIFSFGAALFEMLQGTNPFKVEGQIETLYNVLNREITFDRPIPDELKAIVSKTLEKDREKRYHDFAELKEDLDAFKIAYARLKKESSDSATECLPADEKTQLLNISSKSDMENLGDIVYRIKKIDASTARVSATRISKLMKKKTYWIPILTLLIISLLAATYFVVRDHTPNPVPPTPEHHKFYVYIHHFENNTDEKELPEMLSYLLTESLNQFSEFETIDTNTADSIAGKGDESQRLARLKEKFNIAYELTGKISKDRNFYDIDAYLKPVTANSAPSHFTTTGQLKDSLLMNQVNDLSRRIYARLVREKTNRPPIKSMEDAFGTHWQSFADFYSGFNYYQKADTSRAERFLTRARNIPAAKFYLAEVCFFNGKRKDAETLVHEILPVMDKLPRALQLRVNALDAHLKFKSSDQITYLKNLKEELPFSKEVLYELGEVYFHLAAPEEAMKYYEQALVLDSTYSQALNHLGYCYSYTGNHEKAIELFETFRSLNESTNSFDSLGDGYFFSGDLSNSERMKQRAIVPEDGEPISYPYQTLADIYTLKAEYDKAKNALQEYGNLEKNKKGDAYVLEREAYIDYLEQQYPQALNKINQSLSAYDSDDINDSGYEVHWIKGMILVAMNKIPESKAECSWLERFKTKYQLTGENFNAALKYHLHLEALIAEKENQPERAEQNYKRLMALKSRLSYWITCFHYPFFHTQYAAFLTRAKRVEPALTEINACLQFNANYIPALWVKAEILEKLNRSAEARSIYQMIAELYGNSVERNYFRDRLNTTIR